MQKRKVHKAPSPSQASDKINLSNGPGAQIPLLVNWDDLPLFLRDNEYIHTQYRPASNSYLTSIHSLSYIHNQSGNIYTQLLFVSLLLIFANYLLQNAIPTPDREDVIVFAIFFLGLMTCLSLSFVFHTICNHSQPIQNFWLNLDFMGLLIASSGGFVPGVWYMFYCTPFHTKITLIILNLCAQSITAWVTLFVPIFRTPPWRPIRAGVFGLMGSLAFIPLVAGLFVHGLEEMNHLGGRYYVIAAIFYLSCAGFYGSRWPERWSPGNFDVWGHSHQLFHIAGFLGMLPHIFGLLQAYGYQREAGNC
ncbi:HlyIII-domain-containing protein [Stipitochalara longipes BDJ]|nr:HlyIII-domain-containing protein [Stipitochalara longipes BDJ]